MNEQTESKSLINRLCHGSDFRQKFTCKGRDILSLVNSHWTLVLTRVKVQSSAHCLSFHIVSCMVDQSQSSSASCSNPQCSLDQNVHDIQQVSGELQALFALAATPALLRSH